MIKYLTILFIFFSIGFAGEKVEKDSTVIKIRAEITTKLSEAQRLSENQSQYLQQLDAETQRTKQNILILSGQLQAYQQSLNAFSIADTTSKK